MTPPYHFQLNVVAETGKAYAPFVRRMLRRARAMLRGPLREMTVVFVGDRKMISLHDEFMDLATTTDVLTFPLEEDVSGKAISGEVYVCIAEARRQAKARGVAVQKEVLLYALHGMLHLCGFDDRTGPEYRRMHDREDAILTRLGVGRVFRSETGVLSRKRQIAKPRPRARASGKHE
jgi:probable rRNA maturation factor